MRFLRALVLLILLPGLLVPGGLGFRVCLCAGADACCATDPRDEDGDENVADCCQVTTSCCRSEPLAEPGVGPAAEAQPICACIRVTTPPQPPSTTPGSVGVVVALPLEVEEVRIEWPAPPMVAHAIDARARPPPPRAASRHRPLLL